MGGIPQLSKLLDSCIKLSQDVGRDPGNRLGHAQRVPATRMSLLRRIISFSLTLSRMSRSTPRGRVLYISF